ncbi:chemotaxis response regulator protein-glutamate methylesterase [Prosthecomicrobium hirschii]|uniref:protein-glutamate methylesterase/protein-glutamine glutaminase n=1 Tax=Prosthecodimorpha hirschii TaxID=665126 RepID=UPI001128B9DA|nr:chemotaxis response regulator protein-glutamate methylesterase [Prosthecomicrobium hirschii]TPQ48512.1 chemotaxis response regulator protein-glutamate methylesterase [Prosthecomicrobium hirschii]
MPLPSAAASASGAAVTDPVRVMIVDDAVVVRGLIGRWIDEDPALAVVASHRNGRLAVEDVMRSNPDVVVLDVEMPEMDGLTALPLLLKQKPGLVVVVASTLTRRNAEISLKCLSLGAADYVPKPESNASVTTSPEFKAEIVQKVKTLGLRARQRAGRAVRLPEAAPAPGTRPTTAMAHAPQPQRTPFARPAAQPGRVSATARPDGGKPGITTRAYSNVAPRVLLIGSSTGGPQALTKLFGEIGPAIGNLPVLVTQHMPATFTAILAEHLTKASGRRAAEGVHGEPLMPGRIYVAPGGKHMVIGKDGHDTVVQLNDLPPVNFCKPAVDPLFQSAVPLFGAAILSVVLTGMGHDGAAGAGVIAKAGGSVIAQDEESSVVWGMPGAVAQAGAASEILPLDQIGSKIIRILSGGRP